MCRAQRPNRREHVGFAEDHEVLVEGQGCSSILEVVASWASLDFQRRIGHSSEVEIRGNHSPIGWRGMRRLSKGDYSSPRPMSLGGNIALVLTGNLKPKVVSHLLKIPDVVADEKTLIGIVSKPLIECIFSCSLMRIDVEENDWRCKESVLPFGATFQRHKVICVVDNVWLLRAV